MQSKAHLLHVQRMSCCVPSAGKPDGTFLVRESETQKETLVLCVVYKGEVVEPTFKRVAMEPQTNGEEPAYANNAYFWLLENACELELKYKYSYEGTTHSIDELVAYCQKNGVNVKNGASSLRSTSATLLLVLLISTVSDVALHARVRVASEWNFDAQASGCKWYQF